MESPREKIRRRGNSIGISLIMWKRENTRERAKHGLIGTKVDGGNAKFVRYKSIEDRYASRETDYLKQEEGGLGWEKSPAAWDKGHQRSFKRVKISAIRIRKSCFYLEEEKEIPKKGKET